MSLGNDVPSGSRPTPAERLLQPIQAFSHDQASSGLVLLACAVLAMALVNSPLAGHFLAVWDTKLAVAAGETGIAKSLRFWINDGLMALFFFVVGLEIKRELLVGELSSPRQVVLPLVAAVGGMALPAALYLAFNPSGPGSAGWGIPMATDIAFALGVLALFGERVPQALKVFLAALAIFDDIGAVLVIALFYTDHLTPGALALSGALLAATAAANWLGVRGMLADGVLGVALWIAMLNSGFHATVAGILLALVIPAGERVGSGAFARHGRELIARLEEVTDPNERALGNDRQQSLLREIARACERAGTPLQRLQHALQPWVAYLVVPVFALANAGVALGGSAAGALHHPVTLGVIAGLVVGKPLGIVGCAWLAVKLGRADLPAGVSWPQIVAVGFLAGIGFTMALFIGGLAFAGGERLDAAKIGILGASLLAGGCGAALLWAAAPSRDGRSGA